MLGKKRYIYINLKKSLRKTKKSLIFSTLFVYGYNCKILGAEKKFLPLNRVGNIHRYFKVEELVKNFKNYRFNYKFFFYYIRLNHFRYKYLYFCKKAKEKQNILIKKKLFLRHKRVFKDNSYDFYD
jgi:hypothetical protein